MLIASKKNESSSSILRGLKSDGSGFPIASEDKDTIRGTMDGDRWLLQILFTAKDRTIPG